MMQQAEMWSSTMDNNVAQATNSDRNGNATSTSRPTSTPRKEKTILGWFSRSASANDNDNDNINDNKRQQTNRASNNNNNCNCETRAFRDFRGVQTLRLLWSKRIHSASEEASRGSHAHAGTLRKLNKSVSCLVNAFNNARDWPSVTNNAHESRSKRAASLHNLQEQQQLPLHRDKDNFYKYKNAETQLKMQNKLRRSGSGNNCDLPAAINASATFAAIKVAGGDGERLQWPKRDDVVNGTKCKVESDSLSAKELQSDREKCGRVGEITRETHLISTLNAEQKTLANRVSLSATSAPSGGEESAHQEQQPQHINSTATSTISTNTTSSTVTSQSTPTRAAGTRRKYSFKTHAGKSYLQHHTPRARMSTHTHSFASDTLSTGSGGSSATATPTGGSLVRQLTLQFNEIIQKDARVLEQVKRRNGVWLARGAHVYKIVEKPKTPPEQVETKDELPQRSSSMVQRNIKKFEKLEKPAVPLKSQQLLRRQQEQLQANPSQRPATLSLSKQLRSKRAKQLQQQQQVERERERERDRDGEGSLSVLNEEQKMSTELGDKGVQSDVDMNVGATNQSQSAAESAEQLTQSNDELDAVGDDEKNKEEEEDEEEAEKRQQRRKHKYATIYEKLRFLPFAKYNKKSTQKQSTTANPQEQQDGLQVVTEAEPLPSPCVEADAKILAALDMLDQKLKILAEPTPNATSDELPTSTPTPTVELLLEANDDFEKRLLPNNSFIYQAANKQISNNQLLLNQAVNVTLVNAIEGEQMIMEQKQLATEKKQQLQLELRRELEVDVEPMYEPITPTRETKTEPQASTLFKITNQMEKLKEQDKEKTREHLQVQVKEQPEQSVIELPVEDIYQTVEEATSSPDKPTNWLEGYESIAGSCEASNNHNSSANANDDYEAFDTPAATPTAEEPATPTLPSTTTGTLGRNTRDELPELPKPKRVLPKSPNILRPAPAKPTHASSRCHGSTDEEENIYDTIKGCYESVAVRQHKQTDELSLSSNCYESISNYRKSKAHSITGAGGGGGGGAGATAASGGTVTGVLLSSSGSSLTISSDHRTNSLYESSIAAGVIYAGSGASVGCRSSAGSGRGSCSCSGSGGSNKLVDKRSSIAGSSDNSDAWVDISDGEATAAAAATNEAQFIVVRERFKQHRVRSPDWSKRIRDKRLQQQKAKSCIEDDSDHYYETLSPLGNNRQQQQQQRSKHHSASAHTLGEHIHIQSDEYDSFETDSDEQTEEQQQRLQHHNDSGVDMRNHRLPEPPAPQNQVYAIVRKFRDFISSKKSPKGSQLKLYENTQQLHSGSQFYVECRSSKQDIYEHARSLSSSEKNLAQSPTEQHQHQLTSTASLLRPKQKNGKSLRSRLRKSLVGASFDTKQLSTLSPTRSTFYIEDPPPQLQLQLGSGELDSGFSEKASSGDIPSAEAQKFSTVARKAKKEAKAQRRRATTIGGRPHEPPPPPPPISANSTEQRNSVESHALTPTSWYAECGVFKQASSPSTTAELATPTPSANGGGSSWYAESGLYQTSGISVASSSGSSGVSTGNEAGLGDEMSPHSLFSNEPLYQVYSAAKLESITRDLEAQESSADGYEEVGLHAKMQPSQQTTTKARPTALQLVEPKNGPSRTLWSEIPEVIHSCILPTLTPRERGLQEAKFEIMTSEASYLKSLNLLRRHFMNNTAFCDSAVLNPKDRKALFSYIVPVHECSERLLTELECCWQNNIMLLGLSRRIYEIAERHFHVYITFCEHQGRMDRTLRRLKEAKNGAFQQQLEKLEANPSCCGLNLHSFLMLPMQRITRLPLLIDAVFSKESPHNAEEYESWKLTLALVQKIVAQCNEAANRWEQAYELERISKQLEFPSHIRALAIAPVGVPKQGAKPRFLVKRGELTHLMWRGEDAKLTFGKRFSKASIYAFLFSDLLVLCKRKSDATFSVFDYCPRSMLTLTSGDTLPQLPTKDIKDPTSKNLMLMTLLENYERKTIELVLSCPSVSDQQRWLEAMRPPEAETPGEKLYESWDCPQVIAKHSYESDEPDELQLELGDVVNVSRKLPDGWYQGERIRDGAVGWFPGSYTEELNSAHVRARNLKQRHRLLTFTATYLEAQKVKA